MNSILTILTRRLPLTLAAAALLLAPFMVATSYARDVPLDVNFTGALVPIPVDENLDLTHATVLDGKANGLDDSRRDRVDDNGHVRRWLCLFRAASCRYRPDILERRSTVWCGHQLRLDVHGRAPGWRPDR